MAASTLKYASYAATSYLVLHNRAYADNSAAVVPQPSMSGLDADSLERAAKASRNINNSRLKKQVFEVMNLQEATRLAELDFEKAQYQAHQAQQDIERQRKMAEEQRNLLAQQAQAKAQFLRQKDELDRKRMQTDHETQRSQNAELVKMQELSSERTEKARRASEEQIQAQKRHTEKVKAEIEQETIRVNTMAEAEARALEKKLTEEQKMRTLEEELKGEKDKWLAAIHTTFKHIEDGVWVLLTDRTKLIMAVGGVTAVAAGVYTTRSCAPSTSDCFNQAAAAMDFVSNEINPQPSSSSPQLDFYTSNQIEITSQECHHESLILGRQQHLGSALPDQKHSQSTPSLPLVQLQNCDLDFCQRDEKN
ncbi:hypothetical protein IFM89_016441 [Coptis chinensis]|uniref:ATPase family AAA domain-containing protein n=1 Tax=Coptis chinensis TaxID=261450 RepID=A0A835GXT1_9MAGN|nr:hypothetical protein IFM89_016441 [Coptis chinensis]